jgi:hypothetical protein
MSEHVKMSYIVGKPMDISYIITDKALTRKSEGPNYYIELTIRESVNCMSPNSAEDRPVFYRSYVNIPASHGIQAFIEVVRVFIRTTLGGLVDEEA